jgi:hypothetical protein
MSPVCTSLRERGEATERSEGDWGEGSAGERGKGGKALVSESGKP